MENKKSGGKIFIIIIPLVMIVASIIYDNAIMAGTAKKYRMDSENIIKEVLTNSYADSEKANMVGRLYEDKDYETTQLAASYTDETLYVYNVHIYPSFLSRLFGIKSYRTEVDLKAYYKDGKLIIEDNQGSY